MRFVMCLILTLICAPVALGQAVTSFSGGTEYDSYYGSASGDVVGWQFTVDEQTWITDLGVWNADQTGGVDIDHPVGIWDGSQTLLDSVMVGPSGTVVDDWIYEPTTPIVVMPGETYTIGVMYWSGDDDWYISSAGSMTTDPNVNWLNSVYPIAAEQGFVFPGTTSSSFGRFGPNFIFNMTALDRSTWGAIKASTF